MKIVCTDISSVTTSDIDISVFEKFGDVTLYDVTSPDETANRIKDADMVLVNKTPIGKAEMDAAPRLKYIGLFATGYNIIDTEYAKGRGIVVSNAGQYSSSAVAQHTFALMLEMFSKVGNYNSYVQSGGWKSSKIFTAFTSGTDELFGKTLGIVGYGSIGSAVAKIALSFGMKVIVNTRTPRKERKIEFVSFRELLERSDIITVHCPLTDKTYKMFNSESLSLCKDGVYFINTSRGGVFDEEALAAALHDGKAAGAALDVLCEEPMSEDCPLFGAPGVIFTPHVAWAPLATRKRLIGIVVKNIEAFLDGKPENVVNK